MNVQDLDTPALIISEDILNANLSAMQDICSQNSVDLRPHIKSHKSIAIAKMQREAGAKGISVAKLDEAEVFVNAGFTDILIANQIIGKTKIERLINLQEEFGCFQILIDNYDNAVQISKMAVERGVEIPFYAEIDTGYGRTGFLPEKAGKKIINISKLQNIVFRGLETHEGLFDRIVNPTKEEKEKLAKNSVERLSDVVKSLTRLGSQVQEISVGNSVAAKYFVKYFLITEVRAGDYVFNDLRQLSLGSCDEEQLALSVMCTVTSIHGNRGVIDAGSKTFGSNVQFPRDLLKGRITLVDLSDEHGWFLINDISVNEVHIGSRLRLYPYYVSQLVNLHDKMYIVNDSAQVVQEISIDARGAVH